MIHYRTLSSFILMCLLLLSCKEKEEYPYENELIGEVLDDMTERNLRVVNHINSEVETMGRRGADVKVLNRAQSILEHRKKYKLPLDQKVVVSVQNFSGLDQYLNYLDSVRMKDEYDIKLKYWEHHVDIIGYAKSKIYREFDKSEALNILLSLALLESEFFEDLASMVGAHRDFGMDFNYSFEKDTIHVNEDFEMIMTPQDIDSEFVLKFDYIDSEINLNDSVFNDFELKNIGASAYLKFKPRKKGIYRFKTFFRATFDDGEYTFDQPLEKGIVVLE